MVRYRREATPVWFGLAAVVGPEAPAAAVGPEAPAAVAGYAVQEATEEEEGVAAIQGADLREGVWLYGRGRQALD